MISRAGVIVVLAASVGIMADLAVLQSQPAAAAQKSREIYQSVYNGWKWWHVYKNGVTPNPPSSHWYVPLVMHRRRLHERWRETCRAPAPHPYRT
jgi:hypothetical protein